MASLSASAPRRIVDHDDDQAFLDSIHLSPVATVISDPRIADNPIIAVNQAFCDLTGYDPDFIIGRNCRFLSGPHTEPWITDQIRDAVRLQRPVLVEILNYKRDGTAFRNAVLVAPVFDQQGDLRYFIGSQIELRPDDAGPAVSRHANAVQQIKTLSPRQLEVLEYVAKGLRSKQIAYELNLSERTVKMHRSSVLEKLGVGSMADAVRVAVEAGL